MAKVLLVDDNQLVEKVVRYYLGRYGWEMEFCNGPFGVLHTIKEYKPDFVLLDLMMPGLSGPNLASLMKQMRERDSFKLISFSSEAEKMQKDLVNVGLIDAYFVKGSTLEGLKELMEKTAVTEAARSSDAA